MDDNRVSVRVSDLVGVILEYYEEVLGFKPTKSQVIALRNIYGGSRGVDSDNTLDGFYVIPPERATDGNVKKEMLVYGRDLIANQYKNITCNKTDL